MKWFYHLNQLVFMNNWIDDNGYVKWLGWFYNPKATSFILDDTHSSYWASERFNSFQVDFVIMC